MNAGLKCFARVNSIDFQRFVLDALQYGANLSSVKLATFSAKSESPTGGALRLLLLPIIGLVLIGVFDAGSGPPS